MMKRIGFAIIAIYISFFNFGCGRKGQLLEPVPGIPQPVSNFQVTQKGDRLVFSWTNPEKYLNGKPLNVSSVEIRAMEIKDETVSEKLLASSFIKFSKPLAELKIGQFSLEKEKAELKLDLQAVTAKGYCFGLRTRGKRGGWSEISNLARVKPQLLPLPPRSLQAECFEDRIVLSWLPPIFCIDGKTRLKEVGFNVYRSQGGDFERLNSAPLTESRYDDRQFSFGQDYRYLIRAIRIESPDLGESEDSEILEITPVDIYPPRTPAEAKAIVSEQGVSLSWIPNQEADLAGYRVYRQKEGESRPFLLTAQLLTDPVFFDLTVEKNCLYVYSIMAVDSFSNESPPARIQVKT
ncbi:MAG: fibronectin type III domain-containing protein [Candidatus Saccharicenans sp.]